eukprot:CAMPEP_0201589922 /NCGR_PEP_ID=MMETSP0190_2-20130828/172187_1 /ASSEMBLY_ACC=CAM_ASM_000263 /TAXON_ID=37353 /ORGANISM="Rosalina sp." /LENGTH=89 /DNA_ID=CAMNT_0048045029 /DNA_START=1 /DNA_END=267 /DNA_ORIENTATION=+
MRWNEGTTYCISVHGSHLASIHSESEYQAAKKACGNYDCWLGLSDNTQEGTWVWDDGTITDYGFENNNATLPITPYPWYPNEPNNFWTE